MRADPQEVLRATASRALPEGHSGVPGVASFQQGRPPAFAQLPPPQPRTPAVSTPPGHGHLGEGRCPFLEVSARQAPSPRAPLPGGAVGSHSPSVATVPASKSRQSPRPRASSRTLLSPAGSSRPSSRSPLLSAMGAGARPARGRAARLRSPRSRKCREFHFAPAPGPAQAPPRPPPRPSLPPPSPSPPSPRRPGQVRAPGRLAASGSRSAGAPRSPQRRGSCGRPGGPGGGSPRPRGSLWGLIPGPEPEGTSSLRWAAAEEEDSTRSWARGRTRGAPGSLKTPLDAAAFCGQPGAWPAGLRR